jgi:3-dehydrosphinganine reductase
MYGYSAYCASKWGLRGLAESLQMEVRHRNVFVSVCYPSNTDTPGFEQENQTKPAVVKELEDASATFPPHEVSATALCLTLRVQRCLQVAKALVRGIDKCIFNVALGVEGWLLCQLTAGFAPVTNVFEFAIQVLCASLARFVSLVFSADMYSKVRDCKQLLAW